MSDTIFCNWVQENVDKKTINEISQALGRSYKIVHQRISRTPALHARLKREKVDYTPEEEARILALVNNHRITTIARVLGRSTKAIHEKLDRMKISYKKTTSLRTLMQCSISTGYTRLQLHRARKGLKQVWTRGPAKNRYAHYMITPFQLSQLCNWLKDEGRQVT